MATEKGGIDGHFLFRHLIDLLLDGEFLRYSIIPYRLHTFHTAASRDNLIFMNEFMQTIYMQCLV